MTRSPTDRITKTIQLAAPIDRVWRAITDAQEFSRWFGVQLEGAFVPGQPIRGVFDDFEGTAAHIAAYEREAGLTPTTLQRPQPVFCTVERMEPPHLFSFHWVPFGIDAAADAEREAPTRVEFRLEAKDGGTHLTIEESGFDGVLASRRARAFHMNEGGWQAQAGRIKTYVEAQS